MELFVLIMIMLGFITDWLSFATLISGVAGVCLYGKQGALDAQKALLSDNRIDARRHADSPAVRHRVHSLQGCPWAPCPISPATWSARPTGHQRFFRRLSPKNSPAQGNKFPHAARFFSARSEIFRSTQRDFLAHAARFFSACREIFRKCEHRNMRGGGIRFFCEVSVSRDYILDY